MGKSFREDPVGNGRKGGLASVAQRHRAIDLLWENWTGDFAKNYNKIMNQLAGDPAYVLTEGEKEFCDRYERSLEFVTPKRAREDGKGNSDIGNTVIVVTPQKAKNIDNLLKKM